jgi:hypothetical protein
MRNCCAGESCDRETIGRRQNRVPLRGPNSLDDGPAVRGDQGGDVVGTMLLRARELTEIVAKAQITHAL